MADEAPVFEKVERTTQIDVARPLTGYRTIHIPTAAETVGGFWRRLSKKQKVFLALLIVITLPLFGEVHLVSFGVLVVWQLGAWLLNNIIGLLGFVIAQKVVDVAVDKFRQERD